MGLRPKPRACADLRFAQTDPPSLEDSLRRACFAMGLRPTWIQGAGTGTGTGPLPPPLPYFDL